MLSSLVNRFYRLPHGLQQPVSRLWYAGVARLDRDADMTFMNYGWADLDPQASLLPLRPEDEPNRYCIQLYHRVAAAIDLRGRDVLEVGSGRGGGASYVARYLEPRSMTGMDLTRGSVEFCRRHYAAVPRLSFVQGDAENLPFDPDTFDAVINVESSHCYGSMERFLAGVRRVLRPGGYFLYTDHREAENIPALRRALAKSGLALLQEENINAQVVRALELDDARKQALIRRKVPRVLQRPFNEFAGMSGTHSSYATLRSGAKLYLRTVLRKAG